MGKKTPNQRQRQPVNVQILERSLNNMRNQMTVDMANNMVKFIAEWQAKTYAPLAEAFDGHMAWHALPWYRKLWKRLRGDTEAAEELPKVDDEPEPDELPTDPS